MILVIRDMTGTRIYLDYNATAPLREQARDAILAALDACGNASSVHSEGRAARGLIETARVDVANLVKAAPKNVIFTSGGTEANQMALSPCWGSATTREKPGELSWLFVSAIEHPSVLSGGSFEPDRIMRLGVSEDGVVDLDAMGDALRRFVEENGEVSFLVSVMAANNETGAIQPVGDIADIVHEFGGLFHCDLVQLAGKTELDIGELGADLVSLSAHKLGGPQGVGALILGNEDLLLSKPLIGGGGQETNRRAGTENMPGIVGFGAAAKAALGSLDDMIRIQTLRERIEEGLLTVSSGTQIFSSRCSRLVNVTCFAIKGLSAETQVIALDLAGIAISAGSACSSGKVERSHVLEAMGVDEEFNRGALRISLGWKSSDADVDQFLNAWEKIYRRHKEKQAAA